MVLLILIPLFLAAFAAIVALSGWLLMWAWNTVVPFLWPTAPFLSFWQGVALSVLISIVTGGVRNMISGISWAQKEASK